MVSIVSQFSTGDQSTSIREAFWRSGYSQCQNQECTRDKEQKKSTIKSEDFVAGCRMNGDAYGTTVFTCSECGWKTSFQYDDASDDCYYYETRYFKKKPDPPKPPHPFAGIDRDRWLEAKNVDPVIRTKLRQYDLDMPTLSEMNVRQLKALGLSEAEAKCIVKAFEDSSSDVPAPSVRRQSA